MSRMNSSKAKNVKWLIFVCALFLGLIQNVYAVPADENYDDDVGLIVNGNSFTNDGITYTIVAAGTTESRTSNDPTSPLGNNGSDYFLAFDWNWVGVSSVTISAGGDAFQLASLSFDVIADDDFTITTSSGGSPLIYVSDYSLVVHENLDLTANTAFQNITSFTFSGSNLILNLDDLNFEPAISPNTNPTISNLNGDSVNWAGVNNWVTLDAANNATVADAELDTTNNWADATLTVQRVVSGVNKPLAADLFQFNETGFTVSGNSL